MILRTKDKLVIGLTGSILSGKSTALAFFARNGAFTVSADELVRDLYRTAPVQKKLTAWFGSYEPAVVAGQVFRQPQARVKLEKIAVFEVPLLFEAGWDKLTDLNIVVLGDPRMLRARLKARGLTLAEYKRRLAGQMPEKEKVRRADIILSTREGKEALGLKVERLCRAFESIYGVK